MKKQGCFFAAGWLFVLLYQSGLLKRHDGLCCKKNGDHSGLSGMGSGERFVEKIALLVCEVQARLTGSDHLLFATQPVVFHYFV
jgi:hypothetical protein